MLAPLGENISNLPFGNLNVVNELIDFDGIPMLVHFTNERGEDILSYWVDYDNEAKRYLYVKVSKDELYRYLKGYITLKKLFQEIGSEYVFFADLRTDNSIKKATIISSYLIPENYFAGEMSFYPDGLSTYYADYLKDFEYKQLMRDRSYVFIAEPADKVHGGFLTVKEGAFLLASVTDSIEGYVNVVATGKYERKFTNKSRVNNVVRTLTNYLSPIISHTKDGSFEVWIAIDTISVGIVDEIASEIKAQIIEGYKNDVLDVDFTSAEDAKAICEKFTPIQRKRIYEPILDILENEKIDLTISNKQKSIRNVGKPIKTSFKFKDLVLPPPSIEELQAQKEINKRIYTLMVSLDEGTDISKVGKKEIINNLLLFNDTIDIPYPVTFQISLPNGIGLQLKKPIIATLQIKDHNKLGLENLEFNINVVGKDKNEVIDLFRDAFLSFILKALGRKELMDKKEKDFLNEYVDFNSL